MAFRNCTNKIARSILAAVDSRTGTRGEYLRRETRKRYALSSASTILIFALAASLARLTLPLQLELHVERQTSVELSLAPAAALAAAPRAAPPAIAAREAAVPRQPAPLPLQDKATPPAPVAEQARGATAQDSPPEAAAPQEKAAEPAPAHEEGAAQAEGRADTAEQGGSAGVDVGGDGASSGAVAEAVAQGTDGGARQPLIAGQGSGGTGTDPRGSPGGDPSAAMLDEASRRMAAAQVYPEQARLRRLTGTVQVILEVADDGHLLSAKVGCSSGSALLDKAALALARSIFPLPKPVSLRAQLSIAVIYSLH